MFTHILKLIWKKKKSNFLMMLEIFVSFLILFAVWSLSVYTYRNYVKPSGLKAENVWAVYINFNTQNDTLRAEYRELVRRHLNNVKEVQHFTFSSGNLPFSFSSSNRDFEYEGKNTLSDYINVEPSYAPTLGIEMLAGRWFTYEDTIGKIDPIVITRRMAENLFGNKEEAVGKIVGLENNQQKVVGVIDYFRHKSSFQADENCVFASSESWLSDMLIKVAPDATPEFEAGLARSMQQLGKDWTVEIQHLDDMRRTQDKTIWVPILILFIVCGFLVFNVGLGLFGILFQNINRRKGEIGLRRALGASKSRIWTYFVGETLVIAGFGVFLGLFFAVQLPLLNALDVESAVYGWAMLLAVLSILAMAVGCAFYPSRQAAAIYPATALHEE